MPSRGPVDWSVDDVQVGLARQLPCASPLADQRATEPSQAPLLAPTTLPQEWLLKDLSLPESVAQAFKENAIAGPGGRC